MPKVTEAHMEARRQQILDAAQACFARQGFHQTSMQDICREADLSPGAVYRYFPGKEQIIAASCLNCQEENAAIIEQHLIQSDSTLEVLCSMIDHGFSIIDEPEFQEHAKVTIQLWAESVYSTEIREAYKAATYGTWLKALEDLIVQGQHTGQMDASVDAHCMASIMLAAWHGMVLQKSADPSTDARRCGEALKALCLAALSPTDGPQNGRNRVP